jgi:hypothetical protein
MATDFADQLQMFIRLGTFMISLEIMTFLGFLVKKGKILDLFCLYRKNEIIICFVQLTLFQEDGSPLNSTLKNLFFMLSDV